jgi:uncharacterized protein (TIGR02246 family)
MNPNDIPVRFIEAWNRHDMVALAQLFAADARFVNVVGMFWRSRTEIEAAHVATHKTIFANSRLTILAVEAQSLVTNCVAIHMRWRLEGQLGMEGEQDVPRHGILLFILRAIDDNWEIIVAQNTDIMPGLVPPSSTK